MSTTHSEKALKTLELLGTEGKDWLHPAVEWKLEDVRVVGTVSCPDCGGDREAYYTQEQAVLPRTSQDKLVSDAPAAYVWPKDVECDYTYTHSKETIKVRDGFHAYWCKNECRAAFAAANGLIKQDCRRCYRWGKRGWDRWAQLQSCGTIVAIVTQKFWVGYLQWPKGTQHGVSRFGYGGNSRTQCELCAKGINRSNRVPLVTEKDGKPRAMWVGQDCARKFTGVMPLKLTKEQKKQTSDGILKDNIEKVD